MDEPEVLRPSEVVGQRVRQLREIANLSQQALADRMRDHGVPLHRQTVAAIEAGERRVPLDELLLLAYVLDVAPLHMFVPDGYLDTHRIRISDEIEFGPYVARMWLRGQIPLDGQDARRFELNRPRAEWGRLHADPAGRLVAVAEEVREAIGESDVAGAANALEELDLLARQLRSKLGVRSTADHEENER